MDSTPQSVISNTRDAFNFEARAIGFVHTCDFSIRSGRDSIFRDGVPHGSAKTYPPYLSGFQILVEGYPCAQGNISPILGLRIFAASNKDTHGHPPKRHQRGYRYDYKDGYLR